MLLKRSLHLGYADWSAAEYVSVLGSALSGHVTGGGNIEMLGRAFKEEYGGAGAFAVNSGRGAIRIILNVLRARAPGKGSVIIPAYICPSLPEAVDASRLRAVSVDIAPDLNIAVTEVAAAINADTLAVVVPHMYGCPARVKELEELCAAKGVFLIDDAAQVVGVREAGRPLGSFGDFGIISFAQSKAVVAGLSGAGGMLLVNRVSFLTDVERIVETLPPAPKRVGAYLRFTGDHVLEAFSRDLAHYFHRISDKLGLDPTPSIQVPARISNFEAGIALRQMARLGEVLEERKRVANLYQSHLDAATGFEFPQYERGRFLSRFMLRVPAGGSAARLLEKLKSRHIHTRPGYPTFNPMSTPLPNAEAASAELIEAPFHRGISEASIRLFCESLAAASA